MVGDEIGKLAGGDREAVGKRGKEWNFTLGVMSKQERALSSG